MKPPDDPHGRRPPTPYEIWKANLPNALRQARSRAIPPVRPPVISIDLTTLAHDEVVRIEDGVVRSLGRQKYPNPPGAIQPENLPSLSGRIPAAFEVAVEELDEAAGYVRAADTAETYEDFRQAWKHFLLATQRLVSKLDRLAKHGAGRQWMEQARALRESDPLLRYLAAARNENEHGITEVVLRGEETFGLIFLAEDHARYEGKNLPMMRLAGAAVDIHVTPDSRPVMLTRYVWRAKPMDIAASGRGMSVVPVPATHQGLPIDGTDPLAIARAALTYYRSSLINATGTSTQVPDEREHPTPGEGDDSMKSP